jgi:hypothetical protein
VDANVPAEDRITRQLEGIKIVYRKERHGFLVLNVFGVSLRRGSGRGKRMAKIEGKERRRRLTTMQLRRV